MPNTPAQDLALQRALDERVHQAQLMLGNFGLAAGRVRTPIQIGDVSTLSGVASFTSQAFVAESFQEITMVIEGSETNANFDPILNLIGAGPTAGASNIVYQTSAAQVLSDNTSSMFLAVLDSAGPISVQGRVTIYPLVTGRVRHYESCWHSSGAIRKSTGWGQCTDTTNGITAVGWTGSTSFTGTVRVFGIPA